MVLGMIDGSRPKISSRGPPFHTRLWSAAVRQCIARRRASNDVPFVERRSVRRREGPRDVSNERTDARSHALARSAFGSFFEPDDAFSFQKARSSGRSGGTEIARSLRRSFASL